MQPPQWCASIAVSTHDEPQSVRPIEHIITQAPMSQTCPVGHTIPQPPQFIGSLVRSTQCPLQRSAGKHMHEPLSHTVPIGHVASLSTRPSQSSSMPLQTSVIPVGAHWHTRPALAAASHVHVVGQSATRVHGIVQRPPERQSELTQSALRAHCAPS